MTDREKIITGLEWVINDIEENGNINHAGQYLTEIKDALELLKQPEDKELHLDDLDMLVNMIAIKAKAEGRFFSPYEVELALVQHGQHDERFELGEVIKYSPCEVEQILNEVINDASQNS